MHIHGTVYANPAFHTEAAYEFRMMRSRRVLWPFLGFGAFLLSTFWAYLYAPPWIEAVTSTVREAIFMLALVPLVTAGIGVATHVLGVRPSARRWRGLLADGSIVRDAREHPEVLARFGPRADPREVWAALAAAGAPAAAATAAAAPAPAC
ncbi:hypothetical protein [Microbacterium sp. HJ5]